MTEGCYDFNIYDSYGDGLCCQYGNGSYTLTGADGTVIGSGGDFGSGETVNFCISGNDDNNSSCTTRAGGNDKDTPSCFLPATTLVG